MDMVDPALTRLNELIQDESSGVALAAVKDVLDRAGYTPRQRIEISLKAEAQRIADELGIAVEDVLREAEDILGSRR
jgi:hypothetical protein